MVEQMAMPDAVDEGEIELEAAVRDEPQAAGTPTRRERSTIGFPYNDLDSAVLVAQTIHQRGGGQCDLSQLSAWMGHDTVTSGAFILKVSAARMFGLIEGDRQRIRLTQLGREAIDPQTERLARVRAFLTVPLYRRLYEDYEGRLLPPDVGLERALRDLGVAAKQTDKARQAFQRSAAQAGFFADGRSRLVRPGDAEPAGTPIRLDARRESVKADQPQIEAHDDSAGSAGRRDSGGSGGAIVLPSGTHPAILGLLQTLPPSGSKWPQSERSAWLSAAEMIFRLVFTDDSALPPGRMVRLPYDQEDTGRRQAVDVEPPRLRGGGEPPVADWPSPNGIRQWRDERITEGARETED